MQTAESEVLVVQRFCTAEWSVAVPEDSNEAALGRPAALLEEPVSPSTSLSVGCSTSRSPSRELVLMEVEAAAQHTY